jgi:hypothetical protein
MQQVGVHTHGKDAVDKIYLANRLAFQILYVHNRHRPIPQP